MEQDVSRLNGICICYVSSSLCRLHASPPAALSVCFHLTMSLHAPCHISSTCCNLTPPHSGPIINSQWHFLSMKAWHLVWWIYWHFWFYYYYFFITRFLGLCKKPSTCLTPILVFHCNIFHASSTWFSVHVCFDQQRRCVTARTGNSQVCASAYRKDFTWVTACILRRSCRYF